MFTFAKQVAAKARKHFSCFHALHSSLRMDRIDYTFKFSTELVGAGLSFTVIVFSFGGIGHLQAMGNSNIVSSLAMTHQSNKALYAANTTSVTNVVEHTDGNGLIATAAADVALTPTAGSQTTVIGDNAQISDNTIDNPNPDTVKTLITDQIKVYVTQPGDTLSSIAQQFNLNVSTIMWANNLSSQTIKPGWDLVILPINGVLHKVTANDTLPDMVKQYFGNDYKDPVKLQADMDAIISYNNLASDDDINPGDLLIIPNGTVTPPPAPKPAIANRVTTKKGTTVVVYEPAPGDITEIGGAEHSFPWGECTYYVAKRRNIPWGGNARDWLVNAKAYGAKEGHVPIVGAIMVSGESRYGHVALVEAVSGDQFEVAEMNYTRKGVVDERWISMADRLIKGFIY